MEKLVAYFDPDFGAVAAVVDERGEIIATAAADHRNGIYVAIDEAQVYERTGYLFPAHLWDDAVSD